MSSEQPYRFLDIDGHRRCYSDVAKCNVFESQAEARKSAELTLHNRSPIYVFRLADGLYDWSAIPDPKTPGYPAELVESRPGVIRDV